MLTTINNRNATTDKFRKVRNYTKITLWKKYNSVLQTAPLKKHKSNGGIIHRNAFPATVISSALLHEPLSVGG
jgi:hypothetical protein